MSLTGDLSKLKMGDLFQTLEGSRQTGVLKIWRGPEFRELFFSAQGVRMLHLADLTAERVEQRLLNLGRVNREELASARTHAEQRGRLNARESRTRNNDQKEVPRRGAPLF